MREEVMYPVCPHRNVPAAFQRFLGPDSGGIDRFFPDEPRHRTDGALLVLLQGAARSLSQAIDEFNAGLWTAWKASAFAISFVGPTVHALSAAVGKDAAVLIRRAASLLLSSRLVRLPA
jgi:hypothetical protein